MTFYIDWLMVIRVLFVLGFIFVVGVAAWAVVVVNRMKREQIIAIGTLNALAARIGLKGAIDKIQADIKP